jgi:hypothetical protein
MLVENCHLSRILSISYSQSNTVSSLTGGDTISRFSRREFTLDGTNVVGARFKIAKISKKNESTLLG